MSATIPLPVRPVRAELRPHEFFARASAAPRPMSLAPSRAAESAWSALQRWFSDACAAWRDRRQLRATRLALMNLDDATLRDIGFMRTEIDSVAAEVHGGVAATRSRLLAQIGPPAL